MNKTYRHVLLGIVIILIAGCQSSEKLAMVPASVMHRDVFTCKGLTKDNRWVGVTDQFKPDLDDRVVVVASFEKSDQEKIINYELKNPSRNVVFSENKSYPRKNPLGIYYSMDSLMAQGGEGKWVATVYADGEPIGQQIFYIGDKPESEKEIEGPNYYVVEGDSSEQEAGETQSLSDQDRFANYIQEVTPDLSIPNANSSSSSPGIQ